MNGAGIAASILCVIERLVMNVFGMPILVLRSIYGRMKLGPNFPKLTIVEHSQCFHFESDLNTTSD